MKNKYSFLGASDAALSMFIEIIASNEGQQFSLKIIRNVETKQIHEYLIPGIQTEILSDKAWQRNTEEKILIGVNKSENKRLVYKYFSENHNIQFEDYSILMHKNGSVASTVKLGHGVILNPGVVLAPFAQIGNLVTVNRNVSVGHHSTLSDFCTLHPGVNIAGHCNISSGVTIGMGTNVIDGVSIGENTIVGAGSLVTKDLPDNVVAFGSPAKVVKTISNSESN